MEHLRDLLVRRAARLQERPALSAPGWGTLSWTAWRQRVEAIGCAVLAGDPVPAAVHAATGTAFDWAAEVAAACAGLCWEPGAPVLAPDGLPTGDGRAAYHAAEGRLGPATPFLPGLDHGEFLARLRRLNDTLGWDHDTRLRIPPGPLDAARRGALWSLLYAGGHAVLEGPAKHGDAVWEPGIFGGLGLGQIGPIH